MVKVANHEEEFLNMLLELVHMVCRESGVPKDWSDAVVLEIPKKGDLSYCDNWREVPYFLK